MFARPAFRAARAATPIASRAARASFTVSAKLRDTPEITPAKEIPTTSYADGSVEQSTIVVDQKAQGGVSGVRHSSGHGHGHKIGHLSKSTYKHLTPTMQKMSLMDKIVVVTGGARGLGYCMAEACIQAGAKTLIILDANQELGEQAVADLHKASDDSTPVAFYKVDVRDENAINEAVNQLVEHYGVPDVLINSAGIADSNMPAEKYPTEMWTRLLDINLTGTFLMSRAIGQHMIAAGKPGSMVFIASMSGGIVNFPQEQSCYNASKAGVIQYGKSLATEWAKHNIRVNMISPGYMDTALNNVPKLDAQKVIWKQLTPQNRLGAVDDLNGLAVLLASDASAFMTGSNVIIDGGYTCW